MNTDITEDLANELIQAFKNAEESANKFEDTFVSQIDELIDKEIDLVKTRLKAKFIYLNLKVKKASFITRWYWIKKLEKHTIKMNAFNIALKELEIKKLEL